MMTEIKVNIGSDNGLTAPSHYLNQSWLLINEVLWHSPGAISQRVPQLFLCIMSLKIIFGKLLPHFSGVRLWLPGLYGHQCLRRAVKLNKQTRSLLSIHSLTHSLTPLHSLTHSLLSIHSLTHPLTPPFSHSLTPLHSLTHSPTHPLTPLHSLTHSLLSIHSLLSMLSLLSLTHRLTHGVNELMFKYYFCLYENSW